MLRPQPKAGPGGEHQGAPRNAEPEQGKAHPGRTRHAPPLPGDMSRMHVLHTLRQGTKG